VHETIVPATEQVPVPLIDRSWQVPARAPLAMTQLPLQHCDDVMQVSFF